MMAIKKKYDERKQPEHKHVRSARQTRRAGTLQKIKWGGVEEFQHRTAAHHRDVHEPPHHFIVHNGYDVLKLPLGLERIFFQLVCAVGGTINEDDHKFALSAAHKYGGIYVPTNMANIHSYNRETMAGGGKIGVVIFFSTSAWFFLDKEQTIKSNLKRVWIMERELLF